MLQITTTATFEDGVFKPDAKVDLASGAKVRLVVTTPNPPNQKSAAHPTDDEWARSREQRQKAIADLQRLRTEHPIDTRGERLTRDQLHERR